MERKALELSQFLEKIFGLTVLIPGGSLRLLSVEIFIQSFERQASGTVLQLPVKKNMLKQTSFFLRLFGTNLLHHH